MPHFTPYVLLNPSRWSSSTLNNLVQWPRLNGVNRHLGSHLPELSSSGRSVYPAVSLDQWSARVVSSWASLELVLSAASRQPASNTATLALDSRQLRDSFPAGSWFQSSKNRSCKSRSEWSAAKFGFSGEKPCRSRKPSLFGASEFTLRVVGLQFCR